MLIREASWQLVATSPSFLPAQRSCKGNFLADYFANITESSTTAKVYHSLLFSFRLFFSRLITLRDLSNSQNDRDEWYRVVGVAVSGYWIHHTQHYASMLYGIPTSDLKLNWSVQTTIILIIGSLCREKRFCELMPRSMWNIGKVCVSESTRLYARLTLPILKRPKAKPKFEFQRIKYVFFSHSSKDQPIWLVTSSYLSSLYTWSKR